MTENTPKRRCIRPVGPNGIVNNWSSTDMKVYKKEHIWIISHLSFHDANKTALKSSTFTIDFNGGTKCTWCIVLRLNGESNNKDFIGVFLRLDPTSQCKNVFAKVRFSIMNSDQKEMNSWQTSINEFIISSEKGEENLNSWGTNNFLKRSVLFDGENGLLPNDELTIFCEITYSHVIFTNTSHRPNSIIFQPSISNNRLLENFGSLLKDGEFADVTISVNGTEYPVHKAVLVVRSSVFSAMFKQNGMRESEKNHIDITDIREKVMEEMLRYIYTGKVENLDELADDLFEAADKYDLAELKTMCENALCNNLSVDGAAKTLALADLHHANELRSITMDYIITNAGEVMLTEGWKTVVASQPSNELLKEVCLALSRK